MISKQNLARDNAALRDDLRTIATRISHDLKSHLNSIAAANEALKMLGDAKEPPDALLTRSISDCIDDLVRLMGRVNFVLTATARPKKAERVAMHVVVADALTRLERQTVDKHAVIYEPESWPEVSGVGSWLEEVWWNLISNALRHGGERPKIHLGFKTTKREIRFWISDDGPGVPAEKRESLFQPFGALHHQPGSGGLGLSIVQRLVELQGGRSGHEASAQGPRFFFTLPNL